MSGQGEYITEAQFAKLVMLYMDRHETTKIVWGDMAALSQRENTPKLAAAPSEPASGEATEAMRSEMHAVVQRAGGYRVGLLDEMFRAAIAATPQQAPPVPMRDYVLDFITNTPEDLTHKKLVALGWTPPHQQAAPSVHGELHKALLVAMESAPRPHGWFDVTAKIARDGATLLIDQIDVSTPTAPEPASELVAFAVDLVSRQQQDDMPALPLEKLLDGPAPAYNKAPDPSHVQGSVEDAASGEGIGKPLSWQRTPEQERP